jgi:hypothetical protein
VVLERTEESEETEVVKCVAPGEKEGSWQARC